MTEKVHSDETQRIYDFKIPCKELNNLVDLYKNRKVAEEVEEILQLYSNTEAIANGLKSSLKNGINTQNLEPRINAYGQNIKKLKDPATYCQLCWEAMEDFTMRILLVLGVVSIFIGIFLGEHPEHEWMEGFAIVIAVVAVVNVTAFNDYQKEKKFRQLQNSYIQNDVVQVIRDQKTITLQINDLLVGDIVYLTTGLVLPCDGLLFKCDNIEMDEAAMTGENDGIHKGTVQECAEELEQYKIRHQGQEGHGTSHHDVRSPVVLSGTTVSSGGGKMIVIAVGENSAEGRLFELSAQEEGDTPLQQKLNKIALDISKFGMAAAIFALVAMFLRFGIEAAAGVVEFDSSEHAMEFVGYFLIAITVLAVAIPEGLPLAVTISLAYSVQKMQKQNNLVKKMHACETMGGADMICSDKTGTLTTNDMIIAKFMVDNKIIDIENLQSSNGDRQLPFDSDYFCLVKEAMCANSGITFAYQLNLITGENELKLNGSRTECAMVKFLEFLNHNDFEEQQKSYNYLKINPFSSQRKKSSSVIKLDNEDGKVRVHLKGASEWVFSQCKYILQPNAVPQPISESDKERYINLILQMNGQGLRTICLAYIDIPQDFDYSQADPQTGFPVIESMDAVCIGICGIKDPIRKEVPKAVEQCKRAQIKVRMITGDNEITAKAIAQECNIIQGDGANEVMTGKEFYDKIGGIICANCRLDADCTCPRNEKDNPEGKPLRQDVVKDLEAFKEIADRLSVMARSQPEHKYAMVTGLNQLGHVVAVTGDGTNDAPALKKADIGFAMGIQGTKLAKEVADIILLDDNFASIVVAAKWGRNIYDNIRKFIQFQLCVNVVAVTAAIVGGLTIKQSPLTPVQMLWVNLIMDTFASLALATEDPKDSLLERAPQKRNESIVSKLMWKHILGQSLLQIIITFVLLYAGDQFIPEDQDDDNIKTNGDYVVSGRNYYISGSEDYKSDYNDPDFGPSRHMTMIFNTFVWMQLFNEFNCRRIHDEINIFDGLWGNWLFISILIFTTVVQVIMIQFGGYPFSTSLYGLNATQWFICLALGLLAWPWRLILLLLPKRWFVEHFSNQINPSQLENLGGSGSSRGARVNQLLRKATSG